MNSRKFNDMMTTRRTVENRVHELQKYATTSQILSNSAMNEVKISQARKSKLVSKIAAETLAREDWKRKEDERQKINDKNHQNQKLAAEAQKVNNEKLKMEREIQRICETSEELKDLERKLKIAMVNQDRAYQHEEKLLIQKLESAREQEIEEEMEYNRQMFIKTEIEKGKEKKKKCMEQKSMLQKQIKHNQVRKYYNMLKLPTLKKRLISLLFSSTY